MAKIHPTAIVSASAELAADVEVGPYAIIDGPVRIGAGSVVLAQTQVSGRTTIGAGCKLGPSAFVGLPPQHMRADPDAGSLVVGDGVIIRETATVHRSTAAGEDRATRVGDRCMVMGGSHVAHDCALAADVILSQGVLLGGHVHVGTKAFLGGGSVVHQFCRVGRLSIISGNEALSQDVPPFAAARYGGLKGYNAVGCRRAGMSAGSIRAVRAAFMRLHDHRLVTRAVEEIRASAFATVPEVVELLGFLATTKRGVLPSLRGARHAGGANEDGEPTSLRLTLGDVHARPGIVATNGHSQPSHG